MMDMPPGIKVAATLSFVLAAYGLAIALPLCATGLFTGPHILIPAALHALLGVVLLSAWKGLLHQRCWARWSLLFVSGFMAVPLAAVIARDWLRDGNVPENQRFFLTFPVLFALLAFSVAVHSSGEWFQR
jgi:hypothetical protein